MRRGTLLRVVLPSLALALFMAVIVTLVLDVRRQLQRLDTAASEAVLWALTQAELEASRLEATTLRAINDPEVPLVEIRTRFDIFYSRTDVLVASANYAELRNGDETGAAFDAVLGFLDLWTDVIDGPDSALRAALPALATAARDMREQTRVLALNGITVSAQQSAEQRASVAQTLVRIAWLTLVLVTILLILLVFLVRLARFRESQSRRNRDIRKRIETIIATSLDAVIVIDRDGRIVDYNGAAECIFGHPRDAAIGADMVDLIVPPKYRAAHNAGMARHLITPKAHPMAREVTQLEAMRKDGSLFPVEMSRSSAMTPQGELFVAFIRDISDQVQAEDELRKARDRAIAGEKSKAQLLAVMSHEMRTPLNGILGTLELMDTQGLAKRDNYYLGIIRNSANMLLDQVNNVLDISRLDAGKMQTERRRFDLIALVQDMIDSQIGAAAANGNSLTLKPPSPALHEAYSDPGRLRQVLLNLLSNAIKFTQNGQITIEMECVDGLDEVEIRVIDTGIGISEEDLDRIFGDFVTLDASYQRRSMGTGLGLGISERLAKALGGTLGAESEPGEGSVFWLRLPLAAPEGRARLALPDQASGPETRTDIPALDLLIIEDNAVNRLILRRMLEGDGHHVTEAFDGTQGVNAARETKFDAILMDISMPGVDGLEATRNIRAGDGPNARTPIIATTAHALPEELQAFCDAGMCDALVKPITRPALRKVLQDALTGKRSRTPTPQPSAQHTPIVDFAHLDGLQQDLTEAQRRAAVATFAAEMEAFLTPATLQRAAQDQAREAHRLAGSAGVFGALQLAGQLQSFELQPGGSPEQARADQFEQVRDCWRQTRATLGAAGLMTADPLGQ
ncbi:hybrid sensor histidine kinase/response regulator [Tropicibacter oceani]|uniref:histidine kinase n=1 Tax=Tropicibacter oceani TaxID=3058420 RepID=A0ABY8QH89_9RHOB|nr:ATP-binding protein [Tropicibacter oceani]WGW03527.1 ATP-binding protein [Tropicibacter oceani]